MTTPTKRCIDCGQEFPATPEYFNRTPDNHSGLNPRCKACRSAKRKAEYRDNPAVAQKERQRVRDWYHADVEHARAVKRRSISKNRKGEVERVRQWRAANPDKYQAHNAYSPQRYAMMKRRRARKLQAGGSHTQDDIQRQFEKQHGRCFWCSSPVHTYHADHIIPLSRGGSDNPDNIVIACPSCNGSKQDKLPYTEWIPPNQLVLD